MRALVLAAAVLAGPAHALDGLPFDVGGPFELTDQTGAARTEADPQGRWQLLFFGYANCPSICAVALPMMADAVQDLDASGIDVVPVMITVDPARDSVATIGPPLEAYHPDFVGLTGSDDALQVAYDAYQIEKELLFEDPFEGPIFSHGAHVYLLDPAGEMKTLLPPILSAERVVEIAKGYILTN